MGLIDNPFEMLQPILSGQTNVCLDRHFHVLHLRLPLSIFHFTQHGSKRHLIKGIPDSENGQSQRNSDSEVDPDAARNNSTIFFCLEVEEARTEKCLYLLVIF